MKFLNSKSILDCNEFEEVQHNEETYRIFEKLLNFPDYDCAVIIKCFDEGNNGHVLNNTIV